MAKTSILVYFDNTTKNLKNQHIKKKTKKKKNNISHMRTTISPNQLAAMYSCFGLAGPHQHGMPDVLATLGWCSCHLAFFVVF